MNTQDALARILASLYDAMLDDAHWPATSALIDEACGLTSNALLVAEGPKDDIRVLTVGLYTKGQRHEDVEREYLRVYHPIDERVPCLRQLPDSRLVHVTDLYTTEELKASPTYNEIMLRAKYQNGLNVRLDSLDGSHIAWSLGDPVASDGWGSSQITMIEGLLPHIRQFVRVRQALVAAEARATTVTALLDNPRIGVVQLARRGRIMEGNDRAHTILRRGAVSGSMMLRRSSVLPPFVVHVKPVSIPQPDYGARHVAALVLIVEPRRQHRINPDLVATTLELTPAETQVAVWLAEGKSVRDATWPMRRGVRQPPSTGTCSGSTRSTPSRGRRN